MSRRRSRGAVALGCCAVALLAGCLLSPRIEPGAFSLFGATGDRSAERAGETPGPGSGLSPTPSPAPAATTPPMSFVTIAAGTFQMGSPKGETGRSSNETQHEVTLTHAFDMQATEVTQGQWNALVGNNPSSFGGCDPCPVENVNWYEAAYFANLKSDAEGLSRCYAFSGQSGSPGAGLAATVTVTATGGDPYACTGYRLPTEAEWEYAYRAGSVTAFYNGDITQTKCGLDPNLDKIGWYCGNADSKTHPVAQKQANGKGLDDMAGNVWEWTWDWYSTDYGAVGGLGAVTDPSGPPSGSFRVYRGGSRAIWAEGARAANRGSGSPNFRELTLGFRVARSQPSAEGASAGP